MKAIVLLIILSGIHSNNFEKTNANSKEKTELHFDNKTIDFGVINNDTIIKVKYNYKNITDSTIIITNYSASCFCTDIIISKDTLLAGESGYVELLLDTTHKNGAIKIYGIIESTTYEKFTKLILKGFIQR